MKNTLKTLMIMGALLQGSATFAAEDQIILNTTVGPKGDYTMEVLNGTGIGCKSPQTFAAGSHGTCAFKIDNSFNNLAIKLTQGNATCLLQGNTGDNGARIIVNAGSCTIPGVVIGDLQGGAQALNLQ